MKRRDPPVEILSKPTPAYSDEARRLRVEGDITRELRGRSGRNIGPHPERWATWWEARRAAGGPPLETDPAQVTTAGFFGLRPLTNRVVQVSMAQDYIETLVRISRPEDLRFLEGFPRSRGSFAEFEKY